MTFAVLPDTDDALIDFLKVHPSLTPLQGARVGTTLAGSLTQTRVTNLGGPDTWPWEAVSEYQLECWGGTQTQAYELARTTCSAIYDMRGPIPNGHVIIAKPTLRPLWQPDTNGRARFIVQVQLTATSPS